MKIDQISIIEVAMAVQNGQIEFLGDASRAWGVAFANVVTSSSRRSVLSPLATGSISGRSHSGSAPFTTGIRRKLKLGGGDGVAHSRVGAPQGLSAAVAPQRAERMASMKNIRKPAARTMALRLTNMLRPYQCISGW